MGGGVPARHRRPAVPDEAADSTAMRDAEPARLIPGTHHLARA